MNKIITIIVLALLTFSCKENSNNITVSIKDVPNGRKVTLKKQVDKKIISIDSTTVQNGKFSFNAVIKEPVILGIFIDSIKQGIYPLIGVNDKIHIVADKDSLQISKVSGSKLHSDMVSIKEMEMNLGKKIRAFTTEFQEARKTNDTLKIKEINAKAKVFQDEISLNQWKYIKANPNSHVSVMVLSSLVRDSNFKDSIKIGFDGLSDDVKNSNIAKQLKEYLEKQSKVPVTPTPQAKGLPSKK